MALKIRLARAGSKQRPFYHLVVAENTAPRDGRFVEKVGTYDPRLPSENAARIVLKADRVKHWLSVGAQPTERVALFLGKADLAPMPKQPNRPQKSAPGKKATERAEAKKAKEAAAKEALEKAKAEEKAAKEEAAKAAKEKQVADKEGAKKETAGQDKTAPNKDSGADKPAAGA